MNILIPDKKPLNSLNIEEYIIYDNDKLISIYNIKDVRSIYINHEDGVISPIKVKDHDQVLNEFRNKYDELKINLLDIAVFTKNTLNLTLNHNKGLRRIGLNTLFNTIK